MGKTKIEWTAYEKDGVLVPGYTFNPWIGCTKISDGCRFCYAETMNKRFNWNPAGWGKGKPRRRTSEANWKKPVKWNKEAGRDGTRPRVLCGSLCDIADSEVVDSWKEDLFHLILQTQNLDWLMLTKRIDDYWLADFFDNVRSGITVCNQEEADRDIPKLLKLGVPNFLSIEPMLGEIDLDRWMWGEIERPDGYVEPWRDIDWVIAGFETGPHARIRHPDLARSIRDQCKAADIPFFFKAMSNRAPIPDDLKIQEFPE